MRRFIDGLTYYGIKLYSYVKNLETNSDDLFIEKIVLSPLYKYSCQCCVDGFYQQYLWSLDKPYVIRLGIYNPNCRVPANVEINRQYDKGIHGIVLNPSHHQFSLDNDKLKYVYEFAEDHDLPIIIYLPANLDVLETYNKIKVGLVNWEGKIDEISPRYYLFSSKVFSRRDRLIYASQSPYSGISLIESAKNLPFYDEKIMYENVKEFLNIE
ncbi:hypothetical protein [Acidianus manzaensis]|uniref:Amidohydrolase-related domain-containing protein n=1 Tax=Acidianus manzaensis TaxID=282676 RepID=A0A1W6K2S7_9CREN|nr:hypothetical protein [Acidianus manzaensis]ARM76826.1 hypothetical protein B6F84_12890 [Acidianus manzaensis]